MGSVSNQREGVTTYWYHMLIYNGKGRIESIYSPSYTYSLFNLSRAHSGPGLYLSSGPRYRVKKITCNYDRSITHSGTLIELRIYPQFHDLILESIGWGRIAEREDGGLPLTEIVELPSFIYSQQP